MSSRTSGNAITNGNSNGIDGVAEGHEWLGVNNAPSKSNGKTD